MTITAGLVKELREKTGVGMMECKKALSETNGDLEKAIVWLREKGMSRAAKKAGRVAAEGVVTAAINDSQTVAVLVELNCETDFVSKNEEFLSLAHDCAQIALKNELNDTEKLLNFKLSDKTISERLTELIAKIGENMQLRRVSCLKATNKGLIASYIHLGGKIGSLVAVEGGDASSQKTLAVDLAMHVAASSPKYLTSAEVDKTELNQEREIARKKLIEEGKPEAMIDKILEGQMTKFYKEICLLDQAYVKDPNISVKKHAETLKATVTGFVRFGLGEGIEKKKENFADEVAAAMS